MSTSPISSLGIGSGLDANSIVQQLVALQRQPIADLQTAASKIQTKISAFGQIQSAVSTLQTAAQKLTNPATWSATTATSSDTTSVSATTSTGAVPGIYNVQVTALAASQSVASKNVLPSATSTMGSGILHIDVGSWSGATFTAKPGTTRVDVTIAATDTLSDIQAKINSSNAGITASIVTDASGARLVMQSTATGATNGFRTTVADNDGVNTDISGISGLAYDPGSATAGTALTQSAADASATINGVAVTSPSNTLGNVISGINLNLSKVTTSPVAINVAQDNTSISKAITDFATAYSSLSSLLKDDTKYDAGTKASGPLQGDSTAVGILNRFRSTINTAGANASTVFSNLTTIGLVIQSNGALTVDSTKLTSALSSNLAEVKKLFSNTDSVDPTKNGVATQINSLSASMLAVDGAITTRTSGLNTSIARNQQQQDVLNARAALYEQRLRAQYSALDKTMAGLNTQSSYVSQQITAWSKG